MARDRRRPPTSPEPAGGEVASSEFQASLIEAIHEASPDGILVVGDRNMVVSMNRRFLELWNIPKDWAVPATRTGSGALASDDRMLSRAVELVKDSTSFLKRIQELYADPHLTDYCEIALKDGRTLERHSTGLWGKDGRYLGRVWFFRDITVRKRLEDRLSDLACMDPLTGVSNRRHFFERAAEELARARRFRRALSLVSLDLDHFKGINDGHGHAAGDAVLTDLCAGWTRKLRKVDVFGRIGGEEFVALLPDTALAGACRAAERFRRFAAEHRTQIGDEDVICTVSAGVSTLHDEDGTIDSCLSRADDALYRAKHNGRNRVEREA